jgi:2,5-dioxopentanoate dehydrogenase
MEILGNHLIGADASIASGPVFFAVDPVSGRELEPGFHASTRDDVKKACALADAAFAPYRATSAQVRAAFLRKIADEILGLGATLVSRASLETGLPEPRVAGERDRTVLQLRLFAEVLLSGDASEVALVPADVDRKPMPRPDLRRRFIGVGPVVVFGASNFPLAYSVAGGDTASALAAGCPVIVKGHSAHPGTAELVGKCIQNAVKACGLPEGVFSLLFGSGREVGSELVAHPSIKSVGFTGSQQGGEALMKIAQNRREPIPVHAEMGSLNPVFLLPGALAQRAEALGQAFVTSLTASSGQFCTNPGLVVAIKSPELSRFVESAKSALGQQVGQPMLTPGIHASYVAGLARWSGNSAVSLLGRGTDGNAKYDCNPALLTIEASDIPENPEILHENFGASSVLITCSSFDEMLAFAKGIEGQLTATLHEEVADANEAKALLPLLEQKAGRIICNGWPTGVEVNAAIVHGGPYPSSSDGRTSAVGPLAIRRFLRPVSYQNFPQYLLDAELIG